ncbi:MAG: DUF167 domain-containing protein [Phycisphaeraceae bacterium]|nr:DUF167 domain-containing protein [Phycisphaeraceae bacterium]MBX3405246.1 DUF167 domain-containing protein [Phycisphaeraceae bacterium]
MTAAPLPPYLRPDPDDANSCLLFIKAVPGARRDEIAGPLGDRLKVRTSAPPEGGRANKAICALIAAAVGARASAASVRQGQTNPEKTIRLQGVLAGEAAIRLGKS